MSTRIKLCNLCRAEVKVPLDEQIVQCRVCGSINSYSAPNFAKAPPSKMQGAPLTTQYDNSAKAPPSKMNTGFGYGAPLTSQYDNYDPKSPPSKMNSIGYGAPLTSQYDNNYVSAPPSKMNTGIPNNRYQQEQSFQTPPQRQTSVHAPPPSSPAGGTTEPLSFLLPESLPPLRTKCSYQLSPETLSPQESPHIPADGNNTYFQQQIQPSPQSSPHPDYNRTYFQQLQPSPHNSSPRSPPPLTQTSPPQGSPHSNNNLYRPPIQTPIPTHTTRPPAQTQPSPPPQGSSRPLGIFNINLYPPPSQTPPQTHISPPVQTSQPRASTRPITYFRPPPLGSLGPAHSNGYHQQPPNASSPHSSLTPTDSTDDYYQQQMNTSGYHPQTLQDSRAVSSIPNVSPFLMHSSWEGQRIHQYEYQKSYAQAFSIGNSSGALPYRFIQTATKEPTSTYEHILNSIRNKMCESGASTVGVRQI